MDFILEHLWKIIVLAAIAVASWFGYENWQKKEAWTALGTVYEDAYRAIKTDPTASLAESHGNYWKLLALLKEFQQDVIDGKVKPVFPKEAEIEEANPTVATRWLMDQAMKSSSVGASAQQMIIDGLAANLATCEKYGIFAKDSNLGKMTDGRAPVIPQGPYEGDPLVIVTRVPIEAAPSVARNPANYTLVPESVAAIISTDIDDKTFQFATRLKAAQLLVPLEFTNVSKLFESGRR